MNDESSRAGCWRIAPARPRRRTVMSQASPQQSHFMPVADTNTLRELLTRSESEPVILFKHSLTCPVSARAYRQMSELAAPVSLVVIQEARAVSREVEQLTGVQHESPQ